MDEDADLYGAYVFVVVYMCKCVCVCACVCVCVCGQEAMYIFSPLCNDRWRFFTL
jgi:hypothetical protein